MQALRPLVIWFCLAAALLAWQTYRKLAAGTTVTFNLLIEGKEPDTSASIKLDGVDFTPGDSVSIGKKTLIIEAPGLDPYERKLSVWFGQHDLGDINLTRSKGALTVAAEPKPREIRVTGVDFNQTATNADATFGPILIGTYRVSADFGLFSEERNVEVKRNETTRVEFKPAVGILTLTTQPTNATYRLSAIAGGRVRVDGTTPARVECLPPGDYQVRVWRGEYVKETRVTVNPGQTNPLHVEFGYAEVRFETTPAGAKVFGRDGELGETPLALRDLFPGRHEFRVEKDGFMPLAISLNAENNGPHTIATNLVSVRYGQAIQQARRLSAGANGDYGAALSSVEEALRAMPNDSEALALKARIESAINVRETQLAERKREVELATAARQQEAELKAAEQRRVAELTARKRFPAEAFRKASESEADSRWFETHHWSAQADAGKVADALRRILQREDSGWKLGNEDKVNEDTFQFRCNAVTKLLSTARRHAIVVIGQTAPGEVEIYAKFFDYQSTKVGLSLTQGLRKDGLVPMNPKFFRPEDRPAVEAQRKSVPEDFKTKLFNELR